MKHSGIQIFRIAVFLVGATLCFVTAIGASGPWLYIRLVTGLVVLWLSILEIRKLLHSSSSN